MNFKKISEMVLSVFIVLLMVVFIGLITIGFFSGLITSFVMSLIKISEFALSYLNQMELKEAIVTAWAVILITVGIIGAIVKALMVKINLKKKTSFMGMVSIGIVVFLSEGLIKTLMPYIITKLWGDGLTIKGFLYILIYSIFTSILIMFTIYTQTYITKKRIVEGTIAFGIYLFLSWIIIPLKAVSIKGIMCVVPTTYISMFALYYGVKDFIRKFRNGLNYKSDSHRRFLKGKYLIRKVKPVKESCQDWIERVFLFIKALQLTKYIRRQKVC